MTNLEKVIKGLECCCSPTTYDCKNRCPYTSLYEPGNGYKNCMAALLPDALALLKEQETTFEKDGHHIMCKSCGVYFCDRDREGDQYPQNFCPNCGRRVKQDA